MSVVYQQSRKNFERELARKAAAHGRKVRRDQQRFDLERARERADILRRIAEADARTKINLQSSRN